MNFLPRWMAVVILLGTIPISMYAQQPSKEELEMAIKAMEEAGAAPELIENFRKMMQAQQGNASVPTSNSVDNTSIPVKQVARIATIPKKVLTNPELKAHIEDAQRKIESVMPSEDRQLVTTILGIPECRKPKALAQVANGLWMCANQYPALNLMGRASLEDPNTDNLNNYAAFLVMKGGEEYALPILQRLHMDFPKNTTILNNIGQAWFGLGDIPTAEKYLDSTLTIAASHPQATFTKGIIEEARGNTQAAINLVRKSAVNSYGSGKEDQLQKWGYHLKPGEVSRNIHVPEDPLGFDKWLAAMPEWPMSVAQAVQLEQAWKAFMQQTSDRVTALSMEISRYGQQARNEVPSAKSRRPVNLGRKANLLMRYYSDAEGQKPQSGYTADWMLDMRAKAGQKLAEKAMAIDEKYFNDPMGKCRQLVVVHSEFLADANRTGQLYFKDELEWLKKRIESDGYWGSLTAHDDQTAQAVVKQAQLNFYSTISAILMASAVIDPGFSPIDCLNEKHKPFGKLSDYDDLHCNNVVSYYMPGIGSWSFRCNKTVFDLAPLFIPVKVRFEQNLNTNEFINATVGVSRSGVDAAMTYDFQKGKGSLDVGVQAGSEEMGPVEVSAKVGATIEFDRNGVSDFVVGSSIEASSGNKAAGVNVEADARIGWNAGMSGGVSGKISGETGRAMQQVR